MKPTAWWRAMVLASLVGAALPASAQTIGKKAPDVKFTAEGNSDDKDKDWFLVKRHAGYLVVMYFWRPTNLDSVNTLKWVGELQTKYRPKGVRFIDFVPAKKEDVEKIVAERGFSLLDNHIYDTGVKSLQQSYGAVSEPFVVIIDPRGNIRWRGEPTDRLEERIDFFLKRYPPPAGNKTVLGAMLAKAEKLLSDKEPARAYTLAFQVESWTKDAGGSENGKATTVKDKAKAEAQNWLNQALELEKAKKYEEAARIVAEVSIRMEDEDVARTAEQEIGRMNGTRELKEKIREALKDARAGLVLDEAADLEKNGDYETAARLYDGVVEEFKDTKSAKLAQDALTRIQNDAAAQKVIAAARAERMADRLLDLGERYRRLELYDQAREQFEQLLKDHPDSDAARRAKEEIKSLPASTAQAE